MRHAVNGVDRRSLSESRNRPEHSWSFASGMHRITEADSLDANKVGADTTHFRKKRISMLFTTSVAVREE
jgi:hypothetical protein